MAEKRASRKTKSPRVFGHPSKQAQREVRVLCAPQRLFDLAFSNPCITTCPHAGSARATNDPKKIVVQL